MVVDTQSGGLRSVSIETHPEASALKGAICEETVRVSLQAYGEQMRAVVLTGSLARNEATVSGREKVWRLWGDAEFFLVFQDRAPLPGTAVLRNLAGEIASALRQRGLTCQIGLSAVRAGYFRRIQPHLFAYELRIWGTAVWGDSNVMALIPAFAASRIPLEDAWRLLCNRIIEQLEIAPQAAATQAEWEDCRYKISKLYLDMATSYLVFTGAYAPSYRERNEALGALAGEGHAAGEPSFQAGVLAPRVAAATRFKLTGAIAEGSFLDVRGSNEALKVWKESLDSALRLWRWETTRLTSAPGNRSDGELMRTWMRCQPFSRRLRGWLVVARRRGWIRSWADWPRWARLALRASPRYWVYAAALQLVERGWGAGERLVTSGDTAPTLEELADWLPALRPSQSSKDAWRRLAEEIAWNYHEFLEVTRA